MAFFWQYFNPRAPRGARPALPPLLFLPDLFQSTRPARGATSQVDLWKSWYVGFQSTRPARGATRKGGEEARNRLFQSMRPARGATRAGRARANAAKHFNPRAPRGARPYIPRVVGQAVNISIHAPREGRDMHFPLHTLSMVFQSTRPARGATEVKKQWLSFGNISIHAPREGRDLRSATGFQRLTLFQSTRPARGATTAGVAVIPPHK